jgi:hypothetical protein
VAQRVRLAARQAILRRVDEHAVGARVLDQKIAIGEQDLGVMPRNVIIRQHPIVVPQSADAPTRLKYFARRGAHLSGLLTNDFHG